MLCCWASLVSHHISSILPMFNVKLCLSPALVSCDVMASFIVWYYVEDSCFSWVSVRFPSRTYWYSCRNDGFKFRIPNEQLQRHRNSGDSAYVTVWYRISAFWVHKHCMFSTRYDGLLCSLTGTVSTIKYSDAALQGQSERNACYFLLQVV